MTAFSGSPPKNRRGSWWTKIPTVVHPGNRCGGCAAAQRGRCGPSVFEENGEAAYLIDAATAAEVAAVTRKIEVLGGKVALAMKKLEE